MEIIDFEKTNDPNDKNFGYLHVKIENVGILRMIVSFGHKGKLYFNVPGQYIKSTGESRPWFLFESGIVEYQLKQQAHRYVDEWLKEHEKTA